jgi:hypothetical protein
MPLPLEQKIYLIHGQHVMLDRDLAVLYGVTTAALNQAVKRNIERFPSDFMFEIPLHEAAPLISQSVTSNVGRGGRKKPFLAFTEQGVAMLSSVLRSPQAVQVNIQILRAFVRIRQMILSHEDLRLKLEALEMRYDEQFKIVFDAMRRLIAAEDEPREEIGY